eukprot:TRINITY_DN9360_c0_g3_i4.p1 TRINITY_DN9360_c0_g3~~TRINITY_DN9360_c0_g3_i4.p1  ORF type:complete len:1123 (+),score=250.47 TRINITY_DN9360_c0_g3_i4:420-3371(+)
MEGKGGIAGAFKNVLAEHKRGGYASSTTSSSGGSRLSSAQKILSFDPRLSTGERSSYKASNLNPKASKAALLMDQFSTNLIEMSLSSEMHPRAEKIYSMNAKDTFDQLLDKAAADIIYEQLEVLAAEKALGDEFSTGIMGERSRRVLGYVQSGAKDGGEVMLLSKEISRSMISKTIVRTIKKMSKESIQMAYFGYLIYKGLLSKLTRKFATTTLFNIQSKDTLVKGTANAILINCVKKMCEEEVTKQLNRSCEAEGVGLSYTENTTLPAKVIKQCGEKEMEEEFASVLAGRRNYKVNLEGESNIKPKRKDPFAEEFELAVSNTSPVCGLKESKFHADKNLESSLGRSRIDHMNAMAASFDKIMERTIRSQLAIEINKTNFSPIKTTDKYALIETSAKSPSRKSTSATQHVASRIFDALAKSAVTKLVLSCADTSQLASEIARKVTSNLVLMTTVSSIYQLANASLLKAQVAEHIFSELLNELLGTNLEDSFDNIEDYAVNERTSLMNIVASNEKYKWNIGKIIYEGMIKRIVRENVCKGNMNVMRDCGAVFKEIYETVALRSRKALLKDVVSDCAADAVACELTIDSLLTSTIKREITDMTSLNFHLRRQDCAISNMLYMKLFLKLIAKETATIRNQLFYHTKTAYTIYNSLITSEIENYAAEFIEENIYKLKATVVNDCYDKMLLNVIALNIIKDTVAPCVIACRVYTDLEKQVCKKSLSKELLKVKTAATVFDNLLKKQAKDTAKSLVSNPVIGQTNSKFFEKAIKSLVMKEALKGMTIASVSNSLVTTACARIVRRIGRNTLDDLSVEGLEVLEEAPAIDLKFRSKQVHSSLPKTAGGAVKCKKCGVLLMSQRVGLHSCSVFPVNKETRSLDTINQELLGILRKLENNQISFINSEKLSNDFKTVVVNVLKTNWNVSALERLELAPEKIAKSAEAKHVQVEAAQFSEELIALMQEKIRALEQKEEEQPCEEGTEDQDFVA